VPFEKERIGGDQWLPIWVRNEHLARFRFAAGFAPGKVVVDCASGDGLSGRLLAEAGAARVYGYDLSPEAVQYAQRVNGLANTKFEVASATDLPLHDEAADLFVSLETIEHLDAVDEYLGEVVRVLRSDGKFICSTPNRTVYSPGHTPQSQPWNPFHVREYSPEELKALLSSYFGDVELLGQNLRSRRRTDAMNSLGRLLPFDLTVRANQAAKLPRLVYDRVEHHAVVALDGRREPECLVAVCSKPRKPLSDA
jgi:SAM-dependent methyltransferase